MIIPPMEIAIAAPLLAKICVTPVSPDPGCRPEFRGAFCAFRAGSTLGCAGIL